MKSLNIRMGQRHVLVHYYGGVEPVIDDVVCASRLTKEDYEHIERRVREYEESFHAD